MTARAWNGAVAWLWYAVGCPPRFPLRRVTPGTSLILWDVCDPMTGRPRVIVPGRYAARTVAGLWNRAATAYGSSRRLDYARHGYGWIR